MPPFAMVLSPFASAGRNSNVATALCRRLARTPRQSKGDHNRTATLLLRIFSAALLCHHAIGRVARNEDSPQRLHRRVASEALR
jgi:hypothetical protein